MTTSSGYIPTGTPEAATLTPQTTNISDDSLVENRITGLLSRDNDYMRQAETRGLQQAQQRGLLSSSMAVGAVEGQRIAAALPIAQQDASLYGQRDLQDGAYIQQGHLNTQTFQNDASMATHQGNINVGLQAQQGDINSRLQNEQYGYNTQLADQAFGHNTQLASQQGAINLYNATAQISAQADVNSRLQAEQAIQNRQAQLQTSITNIENNSDLSPDQRNTMIQNEINTYNAMTSAIAISAGLASTTFHYNGPVGTSANATAGTTTGTTTGSTTTSPPVGSTSSTYNPVTNRGASGQTQHRGRD